MRLPKTAHTERPWRVHELTEDFILEDVWRLPTPGGPDDLARLVDQFGTEAEEDKFSLLTRLLFEARWKLGWLLGWDKPEAAVGARVPSLRDRLPGDLAEGTRGPDLPTVPFTSVYQTDTEWVAESANMTVHAVMHIGWVGDEDNGYHAQMAVLAKPNGIVGHAYMAGIIPFRYTIVYPSMLDAIGRRWQRESVR